MRMLVVGHGTKNPALSVRTQLVDSLRFLGHEVVVVDQLGEPEVDAERLQSALGRYVPDVLLNVPVEGSLASSTIRDLTSATGTVSLCLHRGPSCSSAPTDLSDLSLDLLDYDLVTVPDSATFAEFAAEGTFRLSLLRPAVHVPGLDGVVATDRRGVVILGDADPLNVDVVADLDLFDDVTVVGQGWGALPLDVHHVADLDGVELGTVIAGARLVVELPASLAHQSAVGRHHGELGLSDSVLEAAAVGTPAVVLSRPGVAEILEPGVEVLTCETTDDLVALVPMLLASPDELALIGDAAWHRVTSEHTWSVRWDSVFSRWVDPYESDAGEDVRRVSVTEAHAAV